MKTIKLPGMYFALSAMLLISFSTFSAEQPASPAPAAAEKQLWTCGMHPQVILDHPGDCPICHMKLVPLRKADEASKKGDSVLVSPAAIQNMGLLTGTVLKGPLKREIRALGMIVFDETSLADVTMKFKGWAEKLYAAF